MSDDPHADVAAALRGLLAALHRTSLDDASAAELATRLEEMTGRLDGPLRARGYEPDAPGDQETPRDRWRRWSLFRGEHQALAPPMRTERGVDDDGPFIRGRATCGAVYEGPPGAVHGGYLAGLFDDVLGACLALVDGPSGVTGRLTVRYRRPTPLDRTLELTARPVDVRARRFLARAECRVDGQLTAEAEALFVRRAMTRAGE